MKLSRLGVLILLGCASAPSAPATSNQSAHAPAAARTAFRVEVSGHGPPMILIPGLASSGETWATTVEHLRERYTCHVLTLAGFAGVPPIAGPLLPAVKAELVRYVAAERLARPVIVGHSLGGALALDFAAEHADLVGPVVVVDSLPFFAGVMGSATVDEARPILDMMRARMTAQSQAEWEATTRAGTMTRTMVASDADHQRIVGWGLASDRATVREALLALFGADLRPKLPRIAAPVLVIGTWIGYVQPGSPIDRAAVLRTFHDQYASLPHLHFAVTDTAHHFVMLDDLPWFLGQLDRFLADPDAAVRDRGFPAR
jgi:pimeloyl-ACP methyl ester carboxylesterase